MIPVGCAPPRSALPSPDPAIGAGPTRHDAAVTSIAVSRDGRVLASLDANGVVRLGDPASGRPTWSPSSAPMVAVAASPAAVAMADGQALTVVRAATGQTIWTTRCPARSLAFSADGGTLLAVGPEGAVAWRLATGRQLAAAPDPAIAAAPCRDGWALLGATVTVRTATLQVSAEADATGDALIVEDRRSSTLIRLRQRSEVLGFDALLVPVPGPHAWIAPPDATAAVLHPDGVHVLFGTPDGRVWFRVRTDVHTAASDRTEVEERLHGPQGVSIKRT